ncbi:TIR domain-containing protein [Streptomyces sp. DT2A-34]|uniref:TIR domain-containing protein n=1 Tax=Streptomyces sp. DT2A-34 TaxID=3051182 RepID=UPI00265BBA3C|nr:TIR domain-containing protein [Streptomyces sp. DT2A-34]MDO0916396.1 TIR domain-containing protein [Streptomyces sp. DT2A-34]
MHEIFINYRSRGGKEVAYMCDRLLSARFGQDSVFLARKSIGPSQNYVDVLIQAARSSQVLLALIDEGWLDAPDPSRPGSRALDNPQDWVRREIEEALTSRALVVPLFIGHRVKQLDARRLPRSIAELAECQDARLELHSFEWDLARLGDRLVRRIPALATLGEGMHTKPSTRTEPNKAQEPLRMGNGIQLHTPADQR